MAKYNFCTIELFNVYLIIKRTNLGVLINTKKRIVS